MPGQPKSKLPKGVESGVLRDFAKLGGKKGCLTAICKAWSITEREAINLRNAHAQEIREQRQALSVAGIELASHLAGQIALDLSNKKKMRETPLRDKAMAYEKIINGSVTAADGHKPQVSINFGEIRMGRDQLAERDRKTKEMRGAQEAQVV